MTVKTAEVELLTEEEAAAHLRLKPRMMVELRRQGRITFRRLYARTGIRYTWEDLRKFVESSRAES